MPAGRRPVTAIPTSGDDCSSRVPLPGSAGHDSLLVSSHEINSHGGISSVANHHLLMVINKHSSADSYNPPRPLLVHGCPPLSSTPATISCLNACCSGGSGYAHQVVHLQFHILVISMTTLDLFVSSNWLLMSCSDPEHPTMRHVYP